MRASRIPGEASAAIRRPPTAELDDEAMAGEVVELSGEYAERVATAFELLDEHHPTHAEHQYLFILGTRRRGSPRGSGRR